MPDQPASRFYARYRFESEMIIGQVCEPAFALAENEFALWCEGAQMVHGILGCRMSDYGFIVSLQN